MTKELPIKSPDKTSARHLTNGKWSDRVAEIQARIDACPLKAVQKMELKTMLEDMTAKSIAYDIDTMIKSKIIDNVKDFDTRVLGYQADIVDTQSKLAEQEKNLQFHRTVLLDLKEKYLNSMDENEKSYLLEQIDLREDAIRKIESMYNQLLDLRNKIRKELDKTKYMDKTMQIQEEEHNSKMKKTIIDVDLDALQE